MRRTRRAKRSKMEIWASILDCLISEEASMNRVKISANVNQRTAKENLDELISRRLVQTSQSKFVYYSITEDGIKWVKIYRSLMKNESRKANELQVDFQ